MLKRLASPQPIPPSAPTGRSTAPTSEPPQAETPAAPSQAPAAEAPGNKLIVGPNIKLKGSEITDCDILLVEGRVEASMHSRDMRIAEGGIFVGVAEIDTAEVRGTFEGELIVRKRLIIHATGKVTGKIRYGALTVDEGGTLTGDVGSLGAALAMAAAQEAPRQDAGATTAPDEGSKVEDLRPAASVIGRNTARVR